jgi:hypothetical protein
VAKLEAQYLVMGMLVVQQLAMDEGVAQHREISTQPPGIDLLVKNRNSSFRSICGLLALVAQRNAGRSRPHTCRSWKGEVRLEGKISGSTFHICAPKELGRGGREGLAAREIDAHRAGHQREKGHDARHL